VHGSAVFQRGETQGLVLATLGTSKDAQELDSITGGPKSKSFCCTTTSRPSRWVRPAASA